MKKLDIDELHRIVLNIAKEFHRICVENDIPYFIGYGTMLGAVRHKGFIPWDDDMDFYLPRKYWDKFLDVSEKKLNTPFKLVTAKNSWYPIAFAKIQDVRTLMDDPTMQHKKEGRIGIWIDIFPLDQCSSDMKVVRPLMRKRIVIDHIITGTFYQLVDSKERYYVSKLLKFLIQPTHDNMLRWVEKKERISRQVQMTGKGAFVCLYTIYKYKDIYPTNFFGKPKLYQFEDTKLFGVEHYDDYLKYMYGDYMQLPPENKRHIHAEDYYMK